MKTPPAHLSILKPKQPLTQCYTHVLARCHSLEVQDRVLQVLVPKIIVIFYNKLFMEQNVSTSFGA